MIQLKGVYFFSKFLEAEFNFTQQLVHPLVGIFLLKELQKFVILICIFDSMIALLL